MFQYFLPTRIDRCRFISARIISVKNVFIESRNPSSSWRDEWKRSRPIWSKSKENFLRISLPLFRFERRSKKKSSLSFRWNSFREFRSSKKNSWKGFRTDRSSPRPSSVDKRANSKKEARLCRSAVLEGLHSDVSGRKLLNRLDRILFLVQRKFQTFFPLIFCFVDFAFIRLIWTRRERTEKTESRSICRAKKKKNREILSFFDCRSARFDASRVFEHVQRFASRLLIIYLALGTKSNRNLDGESAECRRKEKNSRFERNKKIYWMNVVSNQKKKNEKQRPSFFVQQDQIISAFSTSLSNAFRLRNLRVFFSSIDSFNSLLLSQRFESFHNTKPVAPLFLLNLLSSQTSIITNK